MDEAKALRDRLRDLRKRAGTIQEQAAQADGPERRKMRFELAELQEEIAEGSTRLKELMPKHRITYSKTSSDFSMDRHQFETWAEEERTDDAEGPTNRDIAMVSLKRAQRSSKRSAQGEAYAAARAEGITMAEVARRFGVDKSTVCKVLARHNQAITNQAQSYFQRMKDALAEGMDPQIGKDLIRAVLSETDKGDQAGTGRRRRNDDQVRLLYQLGRKTMDENGAASLDLSNQEVLEAVMGLLSTTQVLYMYLYYGEWLSLREIRDLVGVDKSSVLRCIRRGLERIDAELGGMPFRVEGLDVMEELLMARFNDLDPEDVITHRRRCASGPRLGVVTGKKTRMTEEECRLSAEIIQAASPRDKRGGSGKLLIFLAELTADLEVYLGRPARPTERGRLIRRVLDALVRKVGAWLKKGAKGEDSNMHNTSNFQWGGGVIYVNCMVCTNYLAFAPLRRKGARV